MRVIYPQTTPASADGRTCATFRSRRAARHRRRSARGGSSQSAAESRRRARTPVHRRLPPPRLSADLGRSGRRPRGAAPRSGRSRRDHRLGRLQRALLSDRRPGRDRRRRSQRRPCRARPAQALRPRASAGLRVVPTLLRRRQFARQRRRLRFAIARAARRGEPRLLGRPPVSASPPHRPLRPQHLPLRPARPLHRRRSRRWRGCTAAIRA